jgi:NTP pyrophosphatase (non-canonical NTP hydrolase)
MKMIELRHTFDSEFDEIIDNIMIELTKAECKHPEWPDDIVHNAGIVIEEAGEAMRAALNTYYENENIEELKKELAQTGSTVIRFLLFIERKERGII